MLISLFAGVIVIKMVAVEGLVVGVIDVDQDNMHREMTLMRQGTMIL